jgi:hypothetical protein
MILKLYSVSTEQKYKMFMSSFSFNNNKMIIKTLLYFVHVICSLKKFFVKFSFYSL